MNNKNELYYVYTPKDKPKIYCIDLDGTLTKIEDKYKLEDIDYEVVDAIKELYYSGDIVYIYTARHDREYPLIKAFLVKNQIPFHAIITGKPFAHCYVDDKAMLPDKFKEENTCEKTSESCEYIYRTV